MNRRRFVRLCGGIGIAGIAGCSSSDDNRSTPTSTTKKGSLDGRSSFQFDNRNTGFRQGVQGPTGGVSEQWKVDSRSTLQPIATDDSVYVGGADTTDIRSIDRTDGTEQWTFKTDGDVFSALAVANQTVYISSLDGYLYAVNASDGTERWSSQLVENPTYYEGSGDGLFSFPAPTDDTIYTASNDGVVHAIAASDGSEQWTFETNGGEYYDISITSPAVVDGVTYVNTNGGSLYALDSSTGTEKWRFESAYNSPTISSDTVYTLGSVDDTMKTFVYGLNPADGSEKWSYEVETPVFGTPAVGKDTICFGDTSDRVYAIDTSGNEKWRVQLDTSGNSHNTVMDSSTVYVGKDNKLYALAVTDGTERWHFESDTTFSAPTIASGTIYIGGARDGVYALQSASES